MSDKKGNFSISKQSLSQFNFIRAYETTDYVDTAIKGAERKYKFGQYLFSTKIESSKEIKIKCYYLFYSVCSLDSKIKTSDVSLFYNENDADKSFMELAKKFPTNSFKLFESDGSLKDSNKMNELLYEWGNKELMGELFY